MTLLIIDTERISEKAHKIASIIWGKMKRFPADAKDYLGYLAIEIRNPEKDRDLTMADLLDTQENATLKARKSGSYARRVGRKR